MNPIMTHRHRPEQLSESESDWELIDSPHTKKRPPCLKESNFSPAVMNGPVAGPQSIHSSVPSQNAPSAFNRAASNSDSGNTDSTVKGDAVPARLYYFLNHDYSRDYDSTGQPLTEQAMKALDHEYSVRPCPGDLTAWINSGKLPFRDQSLDLSSSVVMTRDPTRSAATSRTLASYDVVLIPTTQLPDHTAADVCAAGHQFADCPSAYHAYGPNLVMEE